MRKNKITKSIFLLTLLLTGCTQKIPSSPTGSGNTDASVPGSQPKDTGTSSSPDISFSVPTVDPETSEWGTAIVNKMLQYLGGNVLPFVRLGQVGVDDITVEYNKNDSDDDYRSSLELTGGNFAESYLEEAKATFKNYKWEVVVGNGELLATNKTLNLIVKIQSNYDKFFELRAYYEEPFNENDVTDWSAEESAKIKEHFGKFNIPFVYLGTTDYDFEFTDNTNLSVLGGTWNDNVIALFKKAYTGWTITQDPETLISHTATYTDDTSTLTASLTEVNTKAKLTVSITEGFNSTNQNAWPSAILEQAKISCNNQTLPYVYLGAMYPTIDSASTTSRQLVIKGGLWDDSILENAKTAFATEWTLVTAIEEQVENGVKFTKSVGNETLTAIVQKNTAGIPQLTVKRVESYDESLLSSWPTDIKSSFTTKFNLDMTANIPFVYLGTQYPAVNNDYSSVASTMKHDKMVITGGKYDERVLTNFDDAYNEESGWIVAKETTKGYSSGDSDYNDSVVLRSALKIVGDYTYKVGLFTMYADDDKTVYFEIARGSNLSETAGADWSSGAKSVFAQALGGSDVEIPFFNTGKASGEAEFEEGEVSFVYGFNSSPEYQYYTMASYYKTLKDAGWTVTIGHNSTYYNQEAYANNITATKTYGDRKVCVRMTIDPSSYYGFVLRCYAWLEDTYKDVSSRAAAWSSELSTLIENKYGVALPYIYLGTDYPSYVVGKNYDDDYDQMAIMIYGGVYNKDEWNDTWMNIGKAVLNDEGNDWVIDAENTKYSLYATYTKANKDVVNFRMGTTGGRVYIELTYTEGFNADSATEWTEEIKTTFTTELGAANAVPYVYLGTVSPTITKTSYHAMDIFKITGGNWRDEVLPLFKSTLAKETTDWHATYSISSSSWTPSSGTAYILNGDNTAIRLKVTEENEKIVLYVYHDKVSDSVSDTPISWDTTEKYGSYKIKEYFEDQFGSVSVPEFVYGFASETGTTFSMSYSYSATNSNKYVSGSSYSGGNCSFSVYKSMDVLETNGYTVTMNPFGKGDLPSITAEKSDSNGKMTITYNPRYGDVEDDGTDLGYYFNVTFLPSFTFNTDTDWSSSTKATMTNNLNGYVLPFFNMGVKSDEMNVKFSSSTLTIKAYNYAASEIEEAKTKLEADGWVISYKYTYNTNDGLVYKGLNGYLTKDGHTYILNLDPSVSASSTYVTLTVVVA